MADQHHRLAFPGRHVAAHPRRVSRHAREGKADGIGAILEKANDLRALILADDADRQAGTRERLAPHQLLGQAEFLADHREDEIGMRFGEIKKLLFALTQALTEGPTRAESDPALDDLEPAVGLVGPRVEERHQALAAVLGPDVDDAAMYERALETARFEMAKGPQTIYREHQKTALTVRGSYEGDEYSELVDRVERLADAKGCTPAQLALAWVLAQGDDVAPIPGTRRIERLKENLGAWGVQFTAQELAEVRRRLPQETAGSRY